MEFAESEKYKVKMKVNEKKRYLDLARELRKIWSITLIVISLIVGTLKKNNCQKLSKKDLRKWKSEEESKPYSPQQCWDSLEFA